MVHAAFDPAVQFELVIAVLVFNTIGARVQSNSNMYQFYCVVFSFSLVTWVMLESTTTKFKLSLKLLPVLLAVLSFVIWIKHTLRGARYDTLLPILDCMFEQGWKLGVTGDSQPLESPSDRSWRKSYAIWRISRAVLTGPVLLNLAKFNKFTWLQCIENHRYSSRILNLSKFENPRHTVRRKIQDCSTGRSACLIKIISYTSKWSKASRCDSMKSTAAGEIMGEITQIVPAGYSYLGTWVPPNL